jgi:hypothetical protein
MLVDKPDRILPTLGEAFVLKRPTNDSSKSIQSSVKKEGSLGRLSASPRRYLPLSTAS